MAQRKDALISEIIRLSDLSMPPDKFFATFFDRMMQVVDGRGGSIWLCKGDEKTLNCQMNRIPQGVGLETLQVNALVKIIGACISGQRQILIPPEQLVELAASPSDAFNPESLSLICVPFQGGLARRTEQSPSDSTSAQGGPDAPPGGEGAAAGEGQQRTPTILGAVLIFKRLGSDPEVRESTLSLIQLLSAQILGFLAQGMRVSMNGGVGAATALKITSEINSSLNPTEIAYAVVNLASDVIKYDRCCLALKKGDKLQVEAVSGQDIIQKKSALIKRLTSIMEYVSEYGKGLYVTGNLDMAFQNDPEMRENFISYFEASNTKSLVGIPLQGGGANADRGDLLGVLCVESAAVNAYSEDDLGTVDILAQNCATALANARRYRRLPMIRTLDYLAEKRENVARWPRKKLVGLSLAAALIAFILFFCNWDFKVGGGCRILPETRSVLIAPIGSFVLKDVRKREGDMVHKGEVVAELDDRDLRLMLDADTKEYETVCQRAIKCRGEGRTADCTIAELEAEKIKANIELIKWQIEKTKIRARFDGRLLTPRLEEGIGIMMKQGDPLCRMADLNKLVLEISVPEGEISYVAEGMPAEFILNSMPEKKWRAEVVRIAEEATVDRNGKENVFIVTCQIFDAPMDHLPLPGEFVSAEAASGDALGRPAGDGKASGVEGGETKSPFKPGMKGKAKVICGKRKIAYLLVRKLWNFVRLRLWF